MDKITRVGVDLGKRVFHVTAVDASGRVVQRKRFGRAGLRSYLAQLPVPCEVSLEACGSAHHWGRFAQGLGHAARLMSPQFVLPYVQSNKNDVNDADAIVEAAGRPSMRFVGVKPVASQHLQQLHRARQLAVKDRTAHGNQIHGFLLEYGVALPKGLSVMLKRLGEVLEDADNELPAEGRALISDLANELKRLDERVKAFDAKIQAISQQTPACKRLQQIPGVGPMTSTALVAAVGDASHFRNGRELSACLGLVPRQRTTGGKPVLLGISKRGDKYLRQLLIHGARSVLRSAGKHTDRRRKWAQEVERRRGRNVAGVALANKNARTAWAILARKTNFRTDPVPQAAEG